MKKTVEADKKTIVPGGFRGVHPVTRAMVDFRARELAKFANRGTPDVQQVDYEQAKRDVTGETELDRQNAVLDGK